MVQAINLSLSFATHRSTLHLQLLLEIVKCVPYGISSLVVLTIILHHSTASLPEFEDHSSLVRLVPGGILLSLAKHCKGTLAELKLRI